MMSDILKYTTYDQTHHALTAWNDIPETERAQHILSDSREYRVWIQALKNKANMDATYSMIQSMPKITNNFANHLPQGRVFDVSKSK
jgi:hypothetical protein